MNRDNATNIEIALEIGGERAFEFDVNLLYKSFPQQFWLHSDFLLGRQ